MVASVSNYGLAVDRRMEELLSLDSHPLPWDCMYVCNMAVHRDCLGDHRFNRVFDGYWGYEDIELGYRLHRAGLSFSYVPEAFAYHQENFSLSPKDRLEGQIDLRVMFRKAFPSPAENTDSGALMCGRVTLSWVALPGTALPEAD
jgi:hypothetical protein